MKKYLKLKLVKLKRKLKRKHTKHKQATKQSKPCKDTKSLQGFFSQDVMGYFHKVDDREDISEYTSYGGNPIRNLLAAILNRSITDLESSESPVRKDAYNWIMSNCADSWSFIWVMTHIDRESEVRIFREKAESLLTQVCEREYRKETDPDNYDARKETYRKGPDFNLFKEKL